MQICRFFYLKNQYKYIDFKQKLRRLFSGLQYCNSLTSLKTLLILATCERNSISEHIGAVNSCY